MYTFVPTVHGISQPRRLKRVPRCSLTTPPMPRKSSTRWEQIVNAPNISTLPSEFLREVRRIVRARAFVQKVAEEFEWPYFRFTGVLFQKLPISTTCPDGLPNELLSLRRNPDFRVVTVPSGVLFHAQMRSKCELELRGVEICALFEIYGEDVKTMIDTKMHMQYFEADVEKQFKAWSDTGQSLRTESDISTLEPPELFHETDFDYLY